MLTKLQAAKICINSGCYMAIANGSKNNPIKTLLKIINVHGLSQKFLVCMLEKNGL